MTMRCNICFLPIHEDRSLVHCPRCANEFHHDHLAGWLLSNDFCPVCRETLSERFRDEFRPRDEVERRRLQDIMRSLDSVGSMIEQVETTRSFRRDAMMRSRIEEFDIGRTTWVDYLRIGIPIMLLVAAVVVILLAILGS